MTGATSAPRPRAWAVVAVLVTAVHLAALYWPRVTVDGPVTWTDKLVHPLIFLAPLVAWSLWWGRWQPVAVLLTAHAVVSEVVQHTLLPDRTGDPWDVVADLLGVGVGLVLVVPWLRRRRPRTHAAQTAGPVEAHPDRW